MEHTAKLVEDARYSEALEIRWERPVCPQVSSNCTVSRPWFSMTTR